MTGGDTTTPSLLACRRFLGRPVDAATRPHVIPTGPCTGKGTRRRWPAGDAPPRLELKWPAWLDLPASSDSDRSTRIIGRQRDAVAAYDGASAPRFFTSTSFKVDGDGHGYAQCQREILSRPATAGPLHALLPVVHHHRYENHAAQSSATSGSRSHFVPFTPTLYPRCCKRLLVASRSSRGRPRVTPLILASTTRRSGRRRHRPPGTRAQIGTNAWRERPSPSSLLKAKGSSLPAGNMIPVPSRSTSGRKQSKSYARPCQHKPVYRSVSAFPTCMHRQTICSP